MIVPEGAVAIRAPMQATIVSVDVAEGEVVRKGQQVLVLNAMKMEHLIDAPAGGLVMSLVVAPGHTVHEGAPLLFLEERIGADFEEGETARVDLDRVRPDLARVQERRAVTLDEARPDAVAARHAKGRRTAHENIADLCDPGTFVEYGGLVIGQGLRGTLEERLHYAPSEGLVMGIGHINGDQFDETRPRAAIISYEYMVLAGTQGGMNHRKKDRMLRLAERLRLPVVLFAEGGGGRGRRRVARP